MRQTNTAPNRPMGSAQRATTCGAMLLATIWWASAEAGTFDNVDYGNSRKSATSLAGAGDGLGIPIPSDASEAP